MASGISIYSVFQMSEIVILDIQNDHFGYPVKSFWISKLNPISYFM